jgi:UDP-N-acetylmuramyl pentapeptide phosphotransferase/UDP-N-acetylglucosamine-1-phosphate transferase
MNELFHILIPALIAFACTCWIHPYILKVAKVKNIVDNPDARKLQRVPVPVLGGLTVVFGILSGLMAVNLSGDYFDLFPVFASIIIILIVGLMDDIRIIDTPELEQYIADYVAKYWPQAIK